MGFLKHLFERGLGYGHHGHHNKRHGCSDRYAGMRPGTVRCRGCGAVNRETNSYCIDCGESLSARRSACRGCETDLPAGARYCPSCGEKV